LAAFGLAISACDAGSQRESDAATTIGPRAAASAPHDAAISPHRSRDAAVGSHISDDAAVDYDSGTDADGSVAANSAAAAAARRCCEFHAGAMPAQTLAAAEPHGVDIPIDHFIVVMQENRSFDHYFEMLPMRGQPAADVAPHDFANPDPSDGGAPVTIFHETQYCGPDVDHGWDGIHLQYASGALSGFVAASNPGGARALGYFDESDLPYYYGLAKTFAISDRYFTEVMAPTYPNRMFAQSATSFGRIVNTFAPPDAPTIYHQLQTAAQSWMVYCDTRTWEDSIYTNVRTLPGTHFGAIQGFVDDAKAGTLPAFSWVESKRLLTANGDNEHPSSDVQNGQAFVARIVDAVMHGPLWARSAVFITYDEHGGYFDHVAPPPACVPDSTQPELTASNQPGAFDRHGMRVPFIVVSPYAKRHYVSHEVLSHTSILRMVQARFDLPALSNRDANATPPYDLFDFAHATFAQPPALPAAQINAAELARCQAMFP
jgi:phospholipase C